MNIWGKLRKRHILVEKTKASTEKSKLLKKIVMISLLLREITRERRNKRDMLKIKKNRLIAAASSTINKFLSRLRVLKRNGQKMKKHYRSQRQKTTTHH